MKNSTHSFKKTVLTIVISAISMAAAGDAMSATATSTPTNSVTGHEPTLAPGQIGYTDGNSNSKLDVGETVKVETEGSFSDPDGDSERAKTYQWLADGGEITGATNNEYVITANELGKKITLRVIPHTDPDKTDPADGASIVYSGELSVVSQGDLLGVTIDGSPVVNEILTAKATCISPSGSSEDCASDAVSYQWQIETSHDTGSFTDISGEESSTYTVNKEDQKRKIQVVVTNK